jgi:hypothetical protein
MAMPGMNKSSLQEIFPLVCIYFVLMQGHMADNIYNCGIKSTNQNNVLEDHTAWCYHLIGTGEYQ